MKIYSQKAFTLIELLVVVSIMMILALVVMTSVVEARKESRDTARATTAEQLSLGIRLFKEATGKYPDYPNGVELGAKLPGPLDAELAPFIKQIPKDPLTDGEGNDYEYWYYPNFLCNGERHDVVIVKQMEMGDNGNFDEVCGGAVLPYETGLIPKTHAASYGGGGYGQSSYYSQSQYVYAQSAYAPCVVSVSPSTVRLNSSGAIVGALNISWSNNTVLRSVGLYRPDGSYIPQWDRTYSGVPLQHPPTGLSAGTHSVSASGCTAAPLQVNPYIAPTQCNDGVDNADTEDTLVDAADPGCHTNDDLSQPYVSTINSEANVTDYVDTSGGGPVTPTVTENYTSAAYVVFIN
jgi:prepilin-type N-terminal cleavage/methylation domain-containing protein